MQLRASSRNGSPLPLRRTIGSPGIAADAHFRIERQFAQEVHLHLVRRAPSAAVAEHVDALAAQCGQIR